MDGRYRKQNWQGESCIFIWTTGAAPVAIRKNTKTYMTLQLRKERGVTGVPPSEPLPIQTGGCLLTSIHRQSKEEMDSGKEWVEPRIQSPPPAPPCPGPVFLVQVGLEVAVCKTCSTALPSDLEGHSKTPNSQTKKQNARAQFSHIKST